MRLSDAKYLAFGLLVLANYWVVAHRGTVFVRTDQVPSPPAASASRGGVGTGTRSHPTFWSTGYQGGK